MILDMEFEGSKPLDVEFESSDSTFGSNFGETSIVRGNDGLSAYEVAVKNGFEGTEIEWLASLIGKPGEAGKTPYIQDGYWYIDGVNTNVPAEGEDGVGILSVEQTTTSTEDNGTNIVTVTLTNGETFTFEVKNGRKGSDYVLTTDDKQDIADLIDNKGYALQSDLETVERIAKGAAQAVSYGNYSTMITALNALHNDTYLVSQNIMIVTLDVPDLWVSSIAETSVPYTYTNDAAIISALEANGSVQIGYYVLSALETQKVDLSDYVKEDSLGEIVNATLATAKESGEFDGKDGIDGKTPYILNGYWYIGDENTGVKAEGVNGKDGTSGVFIGTMDAYREAYAAGLIAKGTIVIIEEEETSMTAVLGKAILGKMILGKGA